jgi:valyl-tRNA synthetase
MDPEYSRCVQKVFVELYKKGLIYRGKRMVNWCPISLTALSDEEVIMKEQKGSLYYFKVEVVDATPPSHSENSGAGAAATFLTIATTRPETIPGDTAVAVNPKDPRYAKYIGKHVIRPLPAELPREQKLIPIIGDEHVDFEFGTGVLKVTPAHDKADFEIGQRHKLAQIEVITADGHMNDLAGVDLKGLDRFKARKVAVEKLTELGALEKEEPYTNNVGFSERADVPIEPRLSLQWFLKYPSVEKSRACVEQEGGATVSVAASGVSPDASSRAGIPFGGTPNGADGTSAFPGKMRFHPQRWAKVYDHWMGNIQDWCISRQLWWGHRIPVWHKRVSLTEENWADELKSWGWNWYLENGEKLWKEAWSKDPRTAFVARIFRVSDRKEVIYSENSLNPVVPETEGEYDIFLCTDSEKDGQAFEKLGFTQDPDVLDTWFSSWLWPFATMGWPEQTPTLKAFYPTTDLVTGPDIIFFWVARMIMAGYEFMGDLPFQNVYFTGIIRDKQGRKMSKSLGNSPDPLDLIGKYGADALRFGTMRSAPLGQDILFDEQNVELGRNFCNKLWNACRFRQLVGQASSLSPTNSENASKNETGATPVLQYEVQGEINPQLLTSDDKWILLKLDQAIREMNTAFADYKFSDATATLYRFFWSEYCDWYVEASKAVLTSRDAKSETSPSPLQGERDGKRGQTISKSETDAPPLPNPIPPASQGGEGEARRANTLAVIDFVLSHTLRLFHPFLPFITEELWHGMGFAEDMPESQGGTTIMFAPWPKPLDDDFKSHYGLTERDEKHIEARNEFVTQGRNLRRTANIAANKKIKFILKPSRELAAHDVEVLRLLLNAGAVEVSADYQPGKNTLTVRTELGDLFLPLEGLIDKEAETARLKKELEKIEAEAAKVEQKLANPNFTQKVPPAVLLEHQQRLAEWQGKRDHVKSTLEALKG